MACCIFRAIFIVAEQLSSHKIEIDKAFPGTESWIQSKPTTTNLYIYFKFIDECAFILNHFNWKLNCPFSISAKLNRYMQI